MRWRLSLQPYRYTVRYVKGSDSVIADYLQGIRHLFVKLYVVLVIQKVFSVVNKLVVCVLSFKVS